MSNRLTAFWTTFVLPKLKFASTSALATLVDYGLFILLAYSGMDKTKSNLISATSGFLVNFFLQKTFIFESKRSTQQSFMYSLTFSLIGIGISTAIIHFLVKIPFLDKHAFLAKLIATGVMFFYNYYTKQIAFEKKVKW
ncbi:MAG: GtrA family protein [Saprospiraceae bacterium]|nr:GtrA family protein [Saprospiraceae bacterium]